MPDAEEGGGTNLSGTNNQSMTIGSGWSSLDIGEEQMPYFLIIFISIVLLIDLIGGWGGKNEAYGIAVAVVAIVVSIGAMALSYKREEMWTKVGIFIAYFMLLWNTIAAIILTFSGPFLMTSNGYFACWALVFCSMLAAKLKYGFLTQKLKTSGAMEGLLIASIVLIIAIAFSGFGSWRTIFGLIVAVLQVVLCAVFMYMDFSGGGGEKNSSHVYANPRVLVAYGGNLFDLSGRSIQHHGKWILCGLGRAHLLFLYRYDSSIVIVRMIGIIFVWLKHDSTFIFSNAEGTHPCRW